MKYRVRLDLCKLGVTNMPNPESIESFGPHNHGVVIEAESEAEARREVGKQTRTNPFYLHSEVESYMVVMRKSPRHDWRSCGYAPFLSSDFARLIYLAQKDIASDERWSEGQVGWVWTGCDRGDPYKVDKVPSNTEVTVAPDLLPLRRDRVTFLRDLPSMGLTLLAFVLKGGNNGRSG